MLSIKVIILAALVEAKADALARNDVWLDDLIRKI
jgi:hypothetical protein